MFFNGRIRLRCSFLALVLSGAVASPAAAQEWTRFRGPNGQGVSDANTVPVSWTEEDLNWKVELPGNGYGSPVIWGTKLFVNCANDDGTRRIVQCRDTRTGHLIWSQEIVAETHKHHKNNSFASSTPACDERHVYVSWGTPEKLTLMALDHDGNVAWDAPGLGGVKGGHGHGASPVVYRDLVVLNNDQDGESSLLAVDRTTGELQWSIPRNSRRLTYSTPVVYEHAGVGEELVFVNWIHGITAVDPSAGTVRWEIACFPHEAKERAIGGPVLYEDLVIATCAFVNSPKHLVAARPASTPAASSSRGAQSAAVEVWRVDNTTVPHIPTMLVYQDRLYSWNDQGIVTCYAAGTGEKIWQKRIGGKVFGSPVCAGGKLYSITNEGEVICLATGDEFQELGRSDVGEKCQSTPAIANGSMFIRTAGHLLSVGRHSD